MIFNKKAFSIILFFAAFFTSLTKLYSQKNETLNSIIVSVSNRSISEIDYDYGLKKYLKIRKDLKYINTRSSMRVQVIDFLIDRAIVDIITENESISISKATVDGEIKRRMDFLGIKDEGTFAKKIEKEFRIPYKIWKSEIPFELKKRQIIQIRLSVPAPNQSEVKSWYSKNKRKLGLEVRFKMIGFKPKNNSISEETKVYEQINSIRASLIKSSGSFPLVAKGPRNVKELRNNPIFFKWVGLFEVYNFDQNVAQTLSTMRSNTISNIFRDEKQRYVICKLEARRVPPLDKVQANIMNILYQEKESEFFYKWLKEQRKEFSILYFDKAYMKEKKIQVKKESFQFN